MIPLERICIIFSIYTSPTSKLHTAWERAPMNSSEELYNSFQWSKHNSAESLRIEIYSMALQLLWKSTLIPYQKKERNKNSWRENGNASVRTRKMLIAFFLIGYFNICIRSPKSFCGFWFLRRMVILHTHTRLSLIKRKISTFEMTREE